MVCLALNIVHFLTCMVLDSIRACMYVRVYVSVVPVYWVFSVAKILRNSLIVRVKLLIH